MKRRVRNTFISLTCLCFLSPATQCWHCQPVAVLPAQNPRLALAISQCAKREGRRLTHAVVLVTGRRTLCLLLANFFRCLLFQEHTISPPLGIYFLCTYRAALYDPGVPLPVLIPTPPYSVFPLCVSHPALQLSGLRLYSIQQHQPHRLTLHATH